MSSASPNPVTQDRLHFEDLQIGQTIHLGPTTVTKQMIFDFAHEFDPLPFHVDEAAAKKSLLGGLAASGWQTAGLSLRMLVDTFLSKIDSRGGLGFNDLKWKRPVMVNDELSGTVTISGLRRSESHQEWAILELTFDMQNQKGQPVMSMVLNNLVGVRHPEGEVDTAQ